MTAVTSFLTSLALNIQDSLQMTSFDSEMVIGCPRVHLQAACGGVLITDGSHRPDPVQIFTKVIFNHLLMEHKSTTIADITGTVTVI